MGDYSKAQVHAQYTCGDNQIHLMFEANSTLFRQIVAEKLKLRVDEVAFFCESSLPLQWNQQCPDPRSSLHTKPTSTIRIDIYFNRSVLSTFDVVFVRDFGEYFCLRCRYLQEEVYFELFVHNQTTHGEFKRFPTNIF